MYKIKFKRTKNSKWEKGFHILDCVNLEITEFILCKNAEILKEVYKLEGLNASFSLNLTPILKN